MTMIDISKIIEIINCNSEDIKNIYKEIVKLFPCAILKENGYCYNIDLCLFRLQIAEVGEYYFDGVAIYDYNLELKYIVSLESGDYIYDYSN